MINLAVLGKKDLIKYLLKFTFFILIIIVASKILLRKENENNFFIELIDDKKITKFLDEIIPGIKELNENGDEENFYNKINPLEMALKMELGALESIIRTNNIEENIKNSNTEDIASSVAENNYHILEQAKTRIKYTNSAKQCAR